MQDLAPSPAQDPTLTASGAAPASAPPEPIVESPPAAEDPNKERNRLAQLGREKAAEQRRNQALQEQLATQQQELVALRTQMAGVNETLTAQQQAEREARLAALPPAQRTQEELNIVRQELLRTQQFIQQQTQQQQAAQQQVAAQRQQELYKQQRMAELVDDANETHGLAGDLAIQGNEDELDDSGEVAFKASIRALALSRQRLGRAPASGGGTPVAKKEETQSETPDQMEERITQKVLGQLGVRAPNSPKAAPTGSDTPEQVQEDIQTTLRGYDSRRPGATRLALQEIHARTGVTPSGGRRGR